MRNTLYALTALAIALAINAAAPALDNQKPYPFKSAIIKYRISGSIQQGTQTLYIDDHGKKTRTERETTMNVMGRKIKDSSLEIDDGNYRYRIDPIRKTGEKLPSYSKMAEEMVKTMSTEQKNDMGALRKELAKGLTGKEELTPSGKGVILGKACSIYDLMGAKSWVWNNLSLKIENPALGNMVQEAVELKVDVPIEADRFKAPPDVKITEAQGAPAPVQPSKR